MANVIIDNANLTAIASAIRYKKDVETTYKPNLMADAIRSILSFKPEETFTATPKVTSQTITPTEGSVFSSGTVNPIYEEISTAAEMDAVNIDANIGKMYKYTGTTDSKYTNGRLYICETMLNYLCFTANTAGSTVKLTKIGSPAWTGNYSVNGIKWIPYIPGVSGDIVLTNPGDKVYFRGSITDNFNYSNYLRFVMSGSIAASGNINSMYISSDFENLTTLTYEYCYYNMFNNCTSLTTPPELPATTLGADCYYGLFGGCTSLTTPPELPATTLGEGCYFGMFYGCTALITAPELPATTISSYVYRNMFYGCTALTTAPSILPATVVPGTFTYAYMFLNCTSLTTPPIIAATTITGGESLEGMFYGCTSLTSVPSLLTTDIGYTNTYCYMFYGCTSLYISDTPTETASYAYRLPAEGVFSANSTEVLYMFRNCLGVRSSDNLENPANNSYTYYTLNTPV